MTELYRLKYLPTGDEGIPFSMCMKHVGKRKLPDHCNYAKAGRI